MMLSTKNIPFCNRRGVSLVELAVVIAIIGVIAAIGIPQYGRLVAKNKVHRLTNDLVQNMRLTKTIAEKESREYLIVFDLLNDRYLIGFDGNGDGDLLDLNMDGFGVCASVDVDANGFIEGPERTPVNDLDANADGIPDCIKIVNLIDYGNDVAFGYLDGTLPPGPPDPVNDPAIPVDGVDFIAETAVFSRSGSVDDPGYVYFQHLGRGYSYSVAMTSFAGGTSVWRWDGDEENPTVITWTEVR